jgi:cation diffusion facilitator CzcD-associated flavoprotein CzcO
VERFLSGWAIDHHLSYKITARSGEAAATADAAQEGGGEPVGKRVLVIGADPSGLSAAYHLAQRGHEVEIRDAGAEPDGMMRYQGIPAGLAPAAAAAVRLHVAGATVPDPRQNRSGRRGEASGAGRGGVRQRWATYEEMAARGPERFPAADGST